MGKLILGTKMLHGRLAVRVLFALFFSFFERCKALKCPMFYYPVFNLEKKNTFIEWAPLQRVIFLSTRQAIYC